MALQNLVGETGNVVSVRENIGIRLVNRSEMPGSIWFPNSNSEQILEWYKTRRNHVGYGTVLVLKMNTASAQAFVEVN